MAGKNGKRESVTITEQELLEYRGRLAHHEAQRRAFDAAESYLRVYQAKLKKTYDLPDRYEVHLESGEIFWTREPIKRVRATKQAK